MPQNIVEKIWEKHIVEEKEGHPAVFYVDRLLMHEVTSAQAFSVLKERGLKVKNPEQCFATLDHSIPTRKDRHNIHDPAAKNQVETLRKNVKEAGIEFFDMDSGNQGIVHVIGPELGITQPGLTIACGDSHTSTHGAFGALAFGIGTSEVGHILATQCILQKKPKTMKVEFQGNVKKGVYSKDLILKLISKIGVGGANGYIIEYCGEVVENMSMEERMTICNMSIECGARAGLISPDETTFKYLKGRQYSPKNEEWEKSVLYWKSLKSDEDCNYDKAIIINVSDLDPMITWGTTPAQAVEITKVLPDTHAEIDFRLRGNSREKGNDRGSENKRSENNDFIHPKKSIVDALEYTQLKEGQSIEGVAIQWAFVGSCTNGRIEDLRIVADILQGKKVSPNVSFYIVPGSERVRKQAIDEGLDVIFKSAGAEFRMPGCSMCLGMNDDKVPSGERCISSSNRNFIGRQGTGSITHLASPATVAASAISGKITFII